MRRFAKENGLALSFLTLFLGTLVGQSFAGQQNHNATQAEHGEQTLSWWRYVVSPDFGGAVMENWQSEFLQSRSSLPRRSGSCRRDRTSRRASRRSGARATSSRWSGATHQRVGRAGPAPNDWRTRIYENSLSLVMTFHLRHLARAVARRLACVQPGAGGARRAARLRGIGICSTPTSGEDTPELAVRASRDRHDRRLHDLPATTRLPRSRSPSGRRSDETAATSG